MKPTPDLFNAIRPESMPVFSDGRGELVKVLTSSGLGGKAPFGEIYLIRTQPGEVRGRHYHDHTTEWFIALRGKMRIRLVLPGTDRAKDVVLDGADPKVLKVPAGVAHALKPEGEESPLLLAYADREYDPGSPDAVPCEITFD